MSFTKQTPTTPGAYWYRDADGCKPELTEVFILDGKCFSNLSVYSCYNMRGEWEGPLVTAEEAQADASAMREALEKMVRLYESEHDDASPYRPDWLKAALSKDVGRESNDYLGVVSDGLAASFETREHERIQQFNSADEAEQKVKDIKSI